MCEYCAKKADQVIKGMAVKVLKVDILEAQVQEEKRQQARQLLQEKWAAESLEMEEAAAEDEAMVTRPESEAGHVNKEGGSGLHKAGSSSQGAVEEGQIQGEKDGGQSQGWEKDGGQIQGGEKNGGQNQVLEQEKMRREGMEHNGIGRQGTAGKDVRTVGEEQGKKLTSGFGPPSTTLVADEDEMMILDY